MRNRTIEHVTGIPTLATQADRRRIARITTQCRLMYSGMDSRDMVIGDGVVTNLSENGIGIRGNRLVTPGMELVLFVDLPGSEDPVYLGRTGVMGDRTPVRDKTHQYDARGVQSTSVFLVESWHFVTGSYRRSRIVTQLKERFR